MSKGLTSYVNAMVMDPDTGKPMPKVMVVGENGETTQPSTFVRKSTDTKPTGTEGASLYLWDTKEAFIHDGTEWREL